MLTTRYRGTGLDGPHRQIVEVDVFAPTQSLTYLRDALATQPHLLHEDEDLAGVAASLGHLPLALGQAAAYLLNERMAAAAYRDLLADRKESVHTLFPHPDELPDAHRSVAATWSLSTDLAERLSPGIAMPLLRVAALPPTDGILTALFTSAPVRALFREGAGGTVRDADTGMRVLHRLNLLTHTQDRVRIHPLIKRITRDSLSDDQLFALAHPTAEGLYAAMVDIMGNTKMVRDTVRLYWSRL
ncbi:hypothetical protein ABTX61_08805 [Amycolatopsis japonica]|uniref:hypothetical protein n=1 Tax=Amycolatopsis japonica TaxID=208439 RepID=UPI003332EF53